VVLDLIYGNQQTVFSIFCHIWKSQYDVKDAEQEIKETSVLVENILFASLKRVIVNMKVLTVNVLSL
jgi:hypothetical protein